MSGVRRESVSHCQSNGLLVLRGRVRFVVCVVVYVIIIVIIDIIIIIIIIIISFL